MQHYMLRCRVFLWHLCGKYYHDLNQIHYLGYQLQCLIEACCTKSRMTLVDHYYCVLLIFKKTCLDIVKTQVASAISLGQKCCHANSWDFNMYALMNIDSICYSTMRAKQNILDQTVLTGSQARSVSS